MSLPLMASPTFKTNIPSTGQEIKFRPFLVKEEKILLMALEGGDVGEMTVAMKRILDSCIEDDIDVEKLASFDVEFLFLQLRGKSVGEKIELKVGHGDDTECKHKTDIEVNLDDIKVNGVSEDMTIMITDTVGVKVHYPSLADLEKMDASKKEQELVFDMIANCIDVVFDEENVYDDFNVKEMDAWLEGLSQQQFEKITVFFENMPNIKHSIKWKCKECGKEDVFEIEGLQSFFTYL